MKRKINILLVLLAGFVTCKLPAQDYKTDAAKISKAAKKCTAFYNEQCKTTFANGDTLSPLTSSCKTIKKQGKNVCVEDENTCILKTKKKVLIIDKPHKVISLQKNKQRFSLPFLSGSDNFAEIDSFAANNRDKIKYGEDASSGLCYYSYEYGNSETKIIYTFFFNRKNYLIVKEEYQYLTKEAIPLSGGLSATTLLVRLENKYNFNKDRINKNDFDPGAIVECRNGVCKGTNNYKNFKIIN